MLNNAIQLNQRENIVEDAIRGCTPIQVGERLNGIQEVSGSIPLISTKSSLVDGKNLEIERFQGFFLSKSREIAVFAFCACALDF